MQSKVGVAYVMVLADRRVDVNDHELQFRC